MHFLQRILPLVISISIPDVKQWWQRPLIWYRMA